MYHGGKAAGQAKAGGRDCKADGTRAAVSFTHETHHRGAHVAYEITHDVVDIRRSSQKLLGGNGQARWGVGLAGYGAARLVGLQE